MSSGRNYLFAFRKFPEAMDVSLQYKRKRMPKELLTLIEAA